MLTNEEAWPVCKKRPLSSVGAYSCGPFQPHTLHQKDGGKVEKWHVQDFEIKYISMEKGRSWQPKTVPLHNNKEYVQQLYQSANSWAK